MEYKKGQILEHTVQGIQYFDPPMPELETIRGFKKPKSEQFWTRRTEYERWNWNIDPEKGEVWTDSPARGQNKWFEEEIERIHVGEWIMINGVPTYFNKYCYFFFQWFYLLTEQMYPTYKDTSLDYFRFYKICEDDAMTLGDLGIKGRRVGLSSMSASIKLQIGIIENNTLQGIVSKTGDDAQEMYFMVKNGLENLPLFLVPELNKVTDSEIHIAKQAKRISANNKTISGDKGKNNRINWLDTAENAYDGRNIRHVTIDECLAPDTKIMCEGFVFKAIKDINVGDYVIVEGGAKKRVAKKFEGRDEMYLIHQPYAKDYIVSSKHRLYLEQRCKVTGIHDDGIKTMTPVDFINLGKYRKRTTHGLRSQGLDFPDFKNIIDPYVFGAWLGDGNHNDMAFSLNTDDVEVVDFITKYGESVGFEVSHNKVSNSDKCATVRYVRHKTGFYNPYRDELKRLNVFCNKHIPLEYLYNSRENRLKLLAGLIDTDGHCPKGRGAIHITMSREDLIHQIIWLCKSVGLSVSEVRYAKTNFATDSWKISISGDLTIIPTLLPRKQYKEYKQTAKFRRNRIEVSPIGIGDYVGIQVEAETDDDRRLILEDFTITMNCAKWAKVNVQTTLAKISETLVVGASVSGHVSMFSTVNKGDKGGDNFRTIWDGSDHINGKKDMFGRTQTKMKRFFIAGYRGFLGYIGKYGESIIDDPTPEQTEWLKTYINPATGKLACPNPYIGARKYHEETRKMNAHDPELLAEVIRMYPFEWKEVFKGTNNRCNFNLEDLSEQIQVIEDELLLRGTRENGRRMKMIKGDNGAKIPVDAPDGMWYFLELLEGANNKSMYKGSIKCPDNTIYGVAGLDTYANAKATVDKGSDACLMIHKRYDALNPHNSGMPVAMFIGRPTTKEAFHDQVFWALEYFGIKMLAERAPTDWEDYATDEKRRLASPLNHDNKYGYLITTKLSDKRDTYGVPPQNKEAREQHLTEMIEYALNNMKKIKFLRLLKDMRDFDINDRGDYDACMAWGYALMGLKEAVNKTNAISKKVKFLEIRKSKKYNA